MGHSLGTGVFLHPSFLASLVSGGWDKQRVRIHQVALMVASLAGRACHRVILIEAFGSNSIGCEEVATHSHALSCEVLVCVPAA